VQNIVTLKDVGLRYGVQLWFMFFSNIWSFVHLKISLNFKLFGNTDCLHWI